MSIALFAGSAFAWGWDPIGDILNPERIIENVGREAGNATEEIQNIPGNVVRELENAGREIDRMRLEFNAVTSAPALAAWLQGSRDSAREDASPLPTHIREQLGNFFDEDIYDRVRYNVGDGGEINLANLSIEYGDAAAVTLIDTVIFADVSGVNDPILWAHELHHVRQFRDWGVNDFAIRYLRSWNSVEEEAGRVEQEFYNQVVSQNMSEENTGMMQQSSQNNMQRMNGTVFVPPVATMCVTQFGPCPMFTAIPIGNPCVCNTWQGPIGGWTQ